MDNRGDMNAVSTSSSSISNRTVCKNWLEGNRPAIDDTCATGIHQYDLSRIPVCPSSERNEICKNEQCIYRHQSPLECYMYYMGFCPNGPLCFFTHVKRKGPPPPVTEMLDELQQNEHELPLQQYPPVEDDGSP